MSNIKIEIKWWTWKQPNILLQMPKESTTNALTTQTPLEQEAGQRVVKVRLIFDSLHQLQQVLGQRNICQALVQALHCEFSNLKESIERQMKTLKIKLLAEI